MTVAGTLPDDEREKYEYLIENYPDTDSADIARSVLAYYDEEGS